MQLEAFSSAGPPSPRFSYYSSKTPRQSYLGNEPLKVQRNVLEGAAHCSRARRGGGVGTCYILGIAAHGIRSTRYSPLFTGPGDPSVALAPAAGPLETL